VGDRQVTAELERLLYRRHHATGGDGPSVFGLHVKGLGAGLGTSEFDAVALHTWGSRNHRLDIFEIKASRADLLTELRKPEKWQPARELADHFWLVTGPRVVRDIRELPREWGWLEASTGFHRLIERREPVRLGSSDMPLPRSFVVSMFLAECSIPGKFVRKTTASIRDLDAPDPVQEALLDVGSDGR